MHFHRIWCLLAALLPCFLFAQNSNTQLIPFESGRRPSGLRTPFHTLLLGLPIEGINNASPPPFRVEETKPPRAAKNRSAATPWNQEGFTAKRTAHHSASSQSIQTDSSFASSNDLSLAWVRHHASNLVASNDILNAIGTDPSGNVIATGVSQATFSEGDYLTVKYDPKGNQLWTARASNPTGGYSEATALAVDAEGNCIVTGLTRNPDSRFDILTVKYDSTGSEQWRKLYNGAADSDDVATAITVDTTGNVYVTGYSYSEEFDFDYITIKYMSDGTEAWTARFRGLGNGVDVPVAIAVGPGSVTVTGTADGGATRFDIATVRYDASGFRQWVATYVSSGNDLGKGVAVDASGNAYVVGSAATSDSLSDFLVVKYATDGSQSWATTYDGPAHRNDIATVITINRKGSAYVAGTSEGNTGTADYLTTKIDLASGVWRWTRLYDNPYHGTDIANGILLSSEGAIYVTGSSQYNSAADIDFLTLKYDSTGRRLSEVRYNGVGRNDLAAGIAADSIGNVFVGGVTEEVGSLDFAIVKYRANLYGGWYETSTDSNGPSVANALAADREGNIYVAGQAGNAVITMKYNSKGDRLWVTHLTGYEGAATVLRLDRSGNPCIGGYVIDPASGERAFVTAKLDTSGSILWKDIHQDRNTRDNEIIGMALDTSGNIYVTGGSYNTSTRYDIVVMKYSPAGTPVWIDLFDGELGLDDKPAAIVVDLRQDIVVSGSTIGAASSDFVTIKYDPLGIRKWIQFYDGPAHGFDQSFAACVDSMSNVIVTGRSRGINTGGDLTVIKYNRDGIPRDTAWVTGAGDQSDQGIAMLADARGKIYVTGLVYSPSTNTDFVTLQFSPTLGELWRAYYNGPANGKDYPAGLALDGSGNVFVTGTSLASGSLTDVATVKYSGAGKELSVDRFDGVAHLNDQANMITSDLGGNIYIAGSTTDESGVQMALLIKSGKSIEEQWPVRYDGPGVSLDSACDIAVDSSGNVCVITESIRDAGSVSISTTKYDAQGSVLWNSLYAPTDSWAGWPRAVALDKDGSAIVLGKTFGVYPKTDYLTIKYDANGGEEWMQWDQGDGGYNFPVAVAIDESSSVYVGGYSSNPTTHYDFTVLKYSQNGHKESVAHFNGPNNNPDDFVSAMALDGKRNIFLTGFTSGATSGIDFETVKFNADGSQAWAASYISSGRHENRSMALALDAHGNVFVTGWSFGSDSTYDYLTVKYDSLGVQQWASRYPGPSKSNDVVAGIALDTMGNVYVTGSGSPEPYVTSDIFTVKYDSAGVEQWVRQYDGEGHDLDDANSILVDPSGYVCVGGESMAADGVMETLVLRYDAEGVLRWNGRYRLHGSRSNGTTQMRCDAVGNLYVTGTSSTAGNAWRVSTTLKYALHGTDDVKEDRLFDPRSFALLRGYPNPFNPSATLEIVLTGTAYVTIRVYNTLGQEVAALASRERMESGIHRKIFDGASLSSGVYLCRIVAEPVISVKGSTTGSSVTATTKMLLLR